VVEVVLTHPRLVDDLCRKMDVPSNICERAKQILRMADDMGITRYRSGSESAAAALLAAMRELCYPVSGFMVASRAMITSKTLFKMLRLFIAALDIKTTIDPACYAKRIAEMLRLPNDVVEESVKLCRIGVRGKDYIGIAAACVYIASSRIGIGGVTQELLSKITGVSHVTLRKRIKELVKALKYSEIHNIHNQRKQADG
jgi:transcription initiation factor TFIIIB Brf1 subunit/transcription initiation factor TFIIB